MSARSCTSRLLAIVLYVLLVTGALPILLPDGPGPPPNPYLLQPPLPASLVPRPNGCLPAFVLAERTRQTNATSSMLTVCSSCALPMAQAVTADVAASQTGGGGNSSSTLWAASIATLSFRTNQGVCDSNGGYLKGGSVSCFINGSLPNSLLAKYSIVAPAVSDSQRDLLQLWLLQPLVDPTDLHGGLHSLNIQCAPRHAVVRS